MSNCQRVVVFFAQKLRSSGFQPSNIHGGLALANLWQSSGSMGVLRGYVSAVSLGADGPGEPSSLHTTMTGWC